MSVSLPMLQLSNSNPPLLFSHALCGGGVVDVDFGVEVLEQQTPICV